LPARYGFVCWRLAVREVHALRFITRTSPVTISRM
jgi:hypothetical protein